MVVEVSPTCVNLFENWAVEQLNIHLSVSGVRVLQS